MLVETLPLLCCCIVCISNTNCNYSHTTNLLQLQGYQLDFCSGHNDISIGKCNTHMCCYSCNDELNN
jgi:hypothetical protein